MFCCFSSAIPSLDLRIGELRIHLNAKTKWVFPKIGVGPQNGWLIMDNPIKMDDLGGPPLYLETPISSISLGYRVEWEACVEIKMSRKGEDVHKDCDVT